MHEHVFVDETKAKGFILVAAVVPPARLASLRSPWVPPGSCWNVTNQWSGTTGLS
jgi:hypothetical protein